MIPRYNKGMPWICQGMNFTHKSEVLDTLRQNTLLVLKYLCIIGLDQVLGFNIGF